MNKMIIHPKYKHLESFISEIPNRFRNEGTIIYQARNTIKTYETEGISICVKSFHIPAFFNRIIYGLLRSSKARRSYEYGLKLLEKDISTPEPIAYIENKKSGLLYDSYYLCINLPNSGMMREFRYGSLSGRETLLRSFARFAAYIHEQEVIHKDFSPGNILYIKKQDTYTFFLIDINRMAFGTVNMKKGCKNLCRLWGNEEMITFIAREYAKSRGYDEETCIKLTLHYHAIFWKKFTKRHKGALAYYQDENRNS